MYYDTHHDKNPRLERLSSCVLKLRFKMEASWMIQRMGCILMLKEFKQLADNCFQTNHDEQRKKLMYRVGTVVIGFKKANS